MSSLSELEFLCIVDFCSQCEISLSVYQQLIAMKAHDTGRYDTLHPVHCAHQTMKSCIVKCAKFLSIISYSFCTQHVV